LALEFVSRRGFEPMIVPSMARAEAFVGSGHFPDAVDDTYFLGDGLYLAGTAMPHVLSSLQGLQKPVYKNEEDAHGSAKMVLVGVEAMTPGAMKPEEYDQFVRDIANFLDYAAEPIKATRETMGVFVMLFLLVFFVFAYLLKKEYWKDVH